MNSVCRIDRCVDKIKFVNTDWAEVLNQREYFMREKSIHPLFRKLFVWRVDTDEQKNVQQTTTELNWKNFIFGFCVWKKSNEFEKNNCWGWQRGMEKNQIHTNVREYMQTRGRKEKRKLS